MQPIRLGLVGLGKIARDQHLPAIAMSEGIDLVAVASPHGGHDSLPSYLDIESMLAAEPALDAVVLCQPPQYRYDAARTALSAGKHVFLEKPPGATVSEVEALALLAARKGVSLFASWHSRFAAAVSCAKTLLAEAEIQSVHINWKEDVRVWHPGQSWIWELGGFGVFDPGINALSILTEIMPEPVRMIAATLEVPLDRDAPIAAKLRMRSASGVPISADFDFLQTGPQSWDIVIGTSADLVTLSEGGSRLTALSATPEFRENREYPELYRRFVKLVRAGETEADLAPLKLVADAFLLGRKVPVAAFEESF